MLFAALDCGFYFSSSVQQWYNYPFSSLRGIRLHETGSFLRNW